jgi:RNA polymerase sigma-70 factor (ECF subfamily)
MNFVGNDFGPALAEGWGMNSSLLASSAVATDGSTKSPQSAVAKASGASIAGSNAGSELAERGGDGDARIEAARKGDRAAFEKLLAEARPRAIGVAMKVLHNPDDAEDAVQDAFLKAWRNLGRFEGRSAFSTWIHRIVMNSSLDLMRRQSCRPGAGAEDLSERRERADEANNDTPERAMIRTELQVVVAEAMAELSPQHREAVRLRELEEYSYEEIAETAACPIGTVMSRLHHARRKLADELRAALGSEVAALAA